MICGKHSVEWKPFCVEQIKEAKCQQFPLICIQILGKQNKKNRIKKNLPPSIPTTEYTLHYDSFCEFKKCTKHIVMCFIIEKDFILYVSVLPAVLSC